MVTKLSKSNKGKKVFVGLSGGVDSSVAALLLKKQGYDVTGVFMKNWSNTKKLGGECNWVAERQDAMRVAAKLGIPFKTYDFEREYRKKVLKYLIREYKHGRTPNPDIMCNKEVKFKLFLKKAIKDGADLIATGHYAKVGKQQMVNELQYRLMIPKDKEKDQTYFIHILNQKILSKTLFPLGNLTKPEVRNIARCYGFITAEKKDSVGICFVGEVNMREFLKKYLKFTRGDIVDIKGKVLGKHDGLEYFTIGQRAGLNIGGSGPYFVVSKNFKSKKLIVTSNPKDTLLFSRQARIKEMHWISGAMPKIPLSVLTRARHRQRLEKAILKKDKKDFKVIFARPQRALTPGQSLVIYKNGECLGGGVIKSQ
ncbi:MAG: tRNA 2-thiouridine(34) synthase MnmA [Patescibacteria group bacterium]|nr:tRNA 2-thiouridine(34) synthase MnmA [Patescibacteria group bacterium]MDD5490509.1 tRNA 2-thiouridine(34) synthase MnmA [Patescibacteria group bacterium]